MSGKPFDTSASYSIYIEKAFEKHNGELKFTSTILVKSLVNWLTTAEKRDEVFRSMARLMSHSVHMQRLRYIAMDSVQKIRKAADHMSKKTKESLGM